MPIASKLVYFQRRPSPAPPDPDPRRRACRDRRTRGSLSKPVQELVPGKQRDAAATEHVGCVASRARLNRSASDHGRLPDAVRQARERLLQRLNSVDLSGRRQKTWPSEESIWAGLTRPADNPAAGVSTSAADCSILGSLTNCFQFQPTGEPVVPSGKVQERAAEQAAGDADESAALFPQRVPAADQLHHGYGSSCCCCGGGEAEDEEHSAAAECPICLERCAEADGLIRLRCDHVFHSACLERWLRSHRDCPYCRASVVVVL